MREHKATPKAKHKYDIGIIEPMAMAMAMTLTVNANANGDAILKTQLTIFLISVKIDEINRQTTVKPCQVCSRC